MANSFRGEVSADEFGNGHILRMDWNGLAELEIRHGIEWWLTIIGGLERASAKTIREVVSLSLRNGGGTVLTDIPTPNCPMMDLVPKCLDVIALAQRGKTYAQLVEEATSRTKAPRPPETNPPEAPSSQPEKQPADAA